MNLQLTETLNILRCYGCKFAATVFTAEVTCTQTITSSLVRFHHFEPYIVLYTSHRHLWPSFYRTSALLETDAMDLSALNSTLPPGLADVEREMGDKFRGASRAQLYWLRLVSTA